MANPTSITLLPLAAYATSGEGVAVEVAAPRNAVKLKVRVPVYTPTGPVTPGAKLTVRVEARSVVSDPWSVQQTLDVTAAGEYDLAGAALPLTRVTYTITGSVGVTLSVAGTAETAYCTPSDVVNYAVKASGINEVTQTARWQACIVSSTTTDSYLAACHTLPILQWQDDLTEQVSHLAAELIFRHRGANPDGPDILVFDGAKSARAWLDRVQAGRVIPSGIVDSSVDGTQHATSFIASAPARS